MSISLRTRLTLTQAPILVVLVSISIAGAVLLYRLGGLTEKILRENYDSVIYMVDLNEALERIDSSFQLALAGEESKARQQFDDGWKVYNENLQREQRNITELGEADLVSRLTQLSEKYRQDGEAFYKTPAKEAERRHAYFGAEVGLHQGFEAIRGVSNQVRQLNQGSMEAANRQAGSSARKSLTTLGLVLAAGIAVSLGLVWRTVRAILVPVREITQSATAIGQGNLDQVVPVTTRDELGQLASAFNSMARQLRDYRETSFSRLLRAQRTSQATIDAFPDPVMVVDPQRHVEMANPAARRLFGVVPAAGAESSAPAWEPPPPLREPLNAAIMSQQSYLPEGFENAIVIRSDGCERFLLPHVLPINDPYGNTLGAAILLHDITRFRLLDQVKTDLVATVSHELKTPLTGLRLALHLLLEESLGALTPKQTELLVDARENAEVLLARINRLLDMTRLSSGGQQLDLTPQAPATILQSVVQANAPRAKDKEIALAVDAAADLPEVGIDADRFGHALNNLVDNALNYTERGGKVILAARAGADGVTFVVSDSGKGIPAQHLPHIFERFYRIPGMSKEGGTGLGLAIAREIVIAHGGEITCESPPGGGAIFTILLPLWHGPGGPV
jgi:PAS domain S-box-containing protein